MNIYAHRGFSGKYPENTMIAFQQAYELGVDGIELDVQMTKDGELVVIHDERIERTTDGIGYVKDFLYRQLRCFDAGSWFDERFAGERIPALVEVLDWASEQKRAITLNIELKNDTIHYPNLEEKVLKLLDAYAMPHRIVLSSFRPSSLVHLRQLSNTIPLAVLVEGEKKGVNHVAQSIQAEEIHGDPTFLFSPYGQEMSKYMDICVYTINDAQLFTKVAKQRVKTIMTDYPDRFFSHGR